MTRNYGGCAANIAYALKLLGGHPVVTGAVGTDGSDYLYRFEQLEIETSVAKFNDVFTAQCFVTTDKTGSQLRLTRAPCPALMKRLSLKARSVWLSLLPTARKP